LIKERHESIFKMFSKYEHDELKSALIKNKYKFHYFYWAKQIYFIEIRIKFKLTNIIISFFETKSFEIEIKYLWEKFHLKNKLFDKNIG
jgi:hypothetical protein